MSGLADREGVELGWLGSKEMNDKGLGKGRNKRLSEKAFNQVKEKDIKDNG